MYYPEELIEEVRTKNDIVDVISGYVRIQKKGSNRYTVKEVVFQRGNGTPPSRYPSPSRSSTVSAAGRAAM